MLPVGAEGMDNAGQFAEEQLQEGGMGRVIIVVRGKRSDWYHSPSVRLA